MAAGNTEITHVCLSDLHLGEEDSLLTDVSPSDGRVNPSKASPVMETLASCLQSLLANQDPEATKPTLVLAGDILELALARESDALMVFERFIELVMAPDNELFHRIVYLPGNHDHHIWEVGREAQYQRYLANVAVGEPIAEPYHTTGAFLDSKRPDYPACGLLTALVRRMPHLQESQFTVELAYPNYATALASRARCVVFHHGHFIEPIYQLMTQTRSLLFPKRPRPKTIYQLECENFAWIDFFWSALGRSCGVGSDMERVYERLGDPDAREELAESLAREIAQKCDVPYILGDWAEEKVLAVAFKKLLNGFGGLERHRHLGPAPDEGLPLSRDARHGLTEYLDSWLRRQMDREAEGRTLKEIAFVFGHTHKPFATPLRVGPTYEGRVPIYNTGGWVISGVVPDPQHGAAIAVVDRRGEVVNVRMYSEGREDTPSVEEAVVPGDRNCRLFRRIEKLIHADQDPWKKFAAEARRAVFVRAENLHRRISCLR